MNQIINYPTSQSVPFKYNLPKHYKDDTLEAIEFTIQEDGVEVDLTGVTILMQFKKTAKSNTVFLQLEVGIGLTLTDPTNGLVTLDAFIPTLAVGTYIYDAQFTFPSGKVKSYFGGNLQIVQDVSRP